MRIALAGNPNSGKTTLFNALTGKQEKVGNWAGVTVDKKEAAVKKAYAATDETTIVVDLPGAYSMSPYTSEESVTKDYVQNSRPDVIINIVDATNLSRSLFFTTELLELGIPTVIALNKSDLRRKKETVIDTTLLAKRLGCPIVETASNKKEGLKALMTIARSLVGKKQTAPYREEPVPLDKATYQEADKRRFAFVNAVVEEAEQRKTPSNALTLHDKIDKILLNKWLGIPIFAAVMFLVFMISQSWLGALIAEGYTFEDGRSIPGLVTLLEGFQAWVGKLFENADPLVSALLVDGVIGGVIAVVGFLPLVMILYFLIALLEDLGYLSRVAALLDPIFKKVGLSGRSVIPFVMTIGCAVPGIMASRTVRDERERRATAMLAPFIPCGAKIPVISLFAGAFFNNAGWVSALMYLLGIVLVFFGALIVNAITGYRAKRSFFIIELPEYKAPSFLSALKTMCSRGWSYIVKAATIILLCNTAVQLMQSFTWRFTVVDSAADSILADMATPFAYLLLPIVGVLSWQLAAAVITGFIAKENIVGTLAVAFVGLDNLIDLDELAMLEGAGAEVAGVMAISKAAALAYLMFNLFSPPCFAAIGAMNAEMKSGKWVAAGIALQLGIGYGIAYLVYTVGTLLTDPGALNITAALSGLAAILLFAATVTVLAKKHRKKGA